MRRYWTVYKEFVRSSLAREVEFRANFFARLLQNIVWIFFFYFMVEIIYSNTPDIAGWNRGQALALAATAMIINITHRLIFQSMHEIPEQIRKGTLDFVITKPLDSQFWVSTRRFYFNEIGALLSAFGLLAYGISQSGSSFGLPQVLSYLTLLFAALVIFYAFTMFIMTLAVYFVRVDNLWIISEMSLEVARYPVDIYNFGVRQFLTFCLPLAFLGSIPILVLLKNGPLWYVPAGLAIATAGVVFTRFFWQYSLRRYTSASS